MDKGRIVAEIDVLLKNKITELERVINEVQQSANQESKSSMGDKYETGRAMAQNEVFMLQTQLASLRQDFETIHTIDFSINIDKVIQGSLVETSTGWFLLSIGLGKISVDGKNLFCISINSPLGQVLKGKAAGEVYVMNGRSSKIITVI
jgi:hypothetical protein